MDPLDFIISVAREAGELLAQRLDGPRDISYKSKGDLVTDADRAAETLIVERIRTHFAGAAILGEEGGVYRGSTDERFIVDPLDGTTNYAHRYPMFCVSIAYERAGVLEAGAVYGPMLGELYAARRGGTATLNGKPIAVSPIDSVGEALVCTGFVPSKYERNAVNFARLSGAAQAVRRDGSAALDIAFVAGGRFGAFWEYDLKPWDMAAGAVIVEAAGGRVSAIDGAPFDVAIGSILATNGPIHGEMIGLLI